MTPLLLAWVLALAQPVDLKGADLERLCAAPAGSFEQASCMFYVAGFTDGVVAAAGAARAGRGPLACVPGHATGEDLRRATLKSLREHPDRSKATITTVLVMALAEAYPCRARQ